VVEYSTHKPSVEGSNPSTTTERERERTKHTLLVDPGHSGQFVENIAEMKNKFRSDILAPS
jgi:hypothetical protein